MSSSGLIDGRLENELHTDRVYHEPVIGTMVRRIIQVRDKADHVAVSMPTNASYAEDNNAPENIIYAAGWRFGDG